MKALRYLLIATLLSVASLVFATAQSLAQQPEAQMHSTSGMVYSGSTLPSAAAQGTYVTGTTVGTYTPANASGPRRAKKDDWDDEDFNESQEDPFKTPLGDAAVPLMLLALAYVCVRAFRKKRA